MSTDWALSAIATPREQGLAGALDGILVRFAEGAATPAELPQLSEFVQLLRNDAPISVVDAHLRHLSHRGYLRGAMVVLATHLRRAEQPELAVVLARELMDALAPELGIELARSILALPAVEQHRHDAPGVYVQSNLLLGDNLLEGGDPQAALRHYEAILAVDVDHPQALRGFANAIAALERRGFHVEHRSRGLALLEGLDELSLADRLGLERYEIGRPLGRGRHAVVYEAFDRHVGRHVAIKRLLDPRARNDDIPDRVLEARFFAEARTLARVRSPFVVALLAAQPQQRFICIDLCRGGNLRMAMRRGLVGARDLPRIGAQIRAALKAVHAAGAVHRDIKPANLLVRESRPQAAVALADFGLATSLGPGGKSPAVGTLRYLAPELRSGQFSASRATDLFSAGVVMLELALSPQPLPDAFDRVDGMFDASSFVPDDLPENWSATLRSLLADDQKERAW